MAEPSVSPTSVNTKIRVFEQHSVNVQVHRFLDVEAIVGIEDEEELNDEEEFLGESYIFLIHSNLIYILKVSSWTMMSQSRKTSQKTLCELAVQAEKHGTSKMTQ